MPDISFHLNSGSNSYATLVNNDDCGQINPFSSPQRVASAVLRDQISLQAAPDLYSCLSPSSRLWLSWHWAFVCTISSANDALPPSSFLLVRLIPSHSSDARSPVTSSEKSLWFLDESRMLTVSAHISAAYWPQRSAQSNRSHHAIFMPMCHAHLPPPLHCLPHVPSGWVPFSFHIASLLLSYACVLLPSSKSCPPSPRPSF